MLIHNHIYPNVSAIETHVNSQQQASVEIVPLTISRPPRLDCGNQASFDELLYSSINCCYGYLILLAQF